MRRDRCRLPVPDARNRQARDTRSRSDDGACCRTRRQNSHGTAGLGDVEVAYRWHPWAGRMVRVHEVIDKAAGLLARCSLIGDAVSRAQEIPVWMFDAAWCRTVRGAAHPVVGLDALLALRSLLLEADAGPIPAEMNLEAATIASPEENCGDCYEAPLLPPNADAGSSARPSRRQRAVGEFARVRSGTCCDPVARISRWTE